MRAPPVSAAVVLMVLGFAGAGGAQTVPRAEDVQRVERLVATLAQEAATLCPLADPGDQPALDRCRSALFKGLVLQAQSCPHRLVGPAKPGPRRATERDDAHPIRRGGSIRTLPAAIHVQWPIPGRLRHD